MESNAYPIIEHTLVRHPQFREAWDKMHEIHQLWRNQRLKKCMRLYGVSGVGKTSLLQVYRNSYPRYNAVDRTIVPVIYAELPAQPTPASITARLLYSLGDPAFNQGTLNLRLNRLFKLITECGVELILIDEVQHILDRGQVRTHTAIADQLKTILDHSDAAFVLAGAPRLKTLFHINTQLRGRAMSTTTLSPFNIFESSSFFAFKGVLASFAQAMQLENASFLLEEDTISRIFYATDGILRNLSNLFGQTNRLLTSSRHLTMPILHQAFCSELWQPSSAEAAPFSKEFEFRRLTGVDEPYMPSTLDGDNHDPI